ncbi:MAG: hypothetical protein GEU78_10300 [Actinobacteria bacterium]|nr:hypothetical protein [Actinomycetota bacterium]
MTDSAGSPGSEIATAKVEHWGDGTFRAVLNAVAAQGFIRFDDNPTAEETVVINGVTWTFKTSGAAGDQSNLGATVGDTVDNLVTALNASADTDIDDATYSNVNDELHVVHDTAGTGGNAFTLAAGTAEVTLSGAALAGGEAGIEYRLHLSGKTAIARMTAYILGLVGVIGKE